MCLAANFNFVGLHDFLDLTANIAQTDVDSGSLDSSICRVLDSRQQVIVHRVEGQREC